MSARGDRSRDRILQAARALFAEKGFSAVTMQDICAAVSLSRGGLYRHYPSTTAVFAAIIEKEQREALGALQQAYAANRPADVILNGFLGTRVEQITDTRTGIDNAVSEFAASSAEGRRITVERAETTLRILTEIIARGCEQGLYTCIDAAAAALHIICLLEGLAKHHALIPLTDAEIARQIDIVQRYLRLPIV